MKTVLSVNNLSFSYGAAEAFSGVSFVINEGDYVALAGPNGAGKTTLIKVILGLEKKKSGSVEIFGEDSGRFLNWSKIGYLPQRVNVFNPLFPATAEEVVGLGLLSKKKYPKMFNKDDKNKIQEMLEFLNIKNLKDRLASELSGGQQQRVFLARALVSEPELLILDEPSTALDQAAREYFFELVKKLNKERRMTVIIITHDTSQIGEYADKLLFLDKEVVFFGLFNECCKSEEMKKYFGHFSNHLFYHK